MNNVGSIIRFAVITLSAVFIAGCVNWSRDIARYRAVLDTASPSTRPSYSPDDALTLSQALALANANNEAIASSGEDYIQALAEKMRQAGTFMPSLSLAPSYTLTNNDDSGTSRQTSVPLQASASGSLPQLSDQKAAGLSADQRQQLLLDQRESVLLLVAQSYYTVLKAERQTSVYESSVKSKTERVRDQETRYKLGNVRPLDVAQTQADFAGARASLTQSQTDSANARSALARLIGTPSVSGPLLDEYRLPDDLGSLNNWQALGASNRQDLLAAAKATESARARLESAIRKYFPSVGINFNYFLYFDSSSTQNWTGAISANLPIFSAMSIEADIRKAWSIYRQSGLAESQIRRQVVDEIKQSYQSLQGNRSRIADLTTQVEAAKRAFDLAERSYQLGQVSNLDRLVQQDNLLTAQLNLISEQFDEKINYLTLLRSAGEMASQI